MSSETIFITTNSSFLQLLQPSSSLNATISYGYFESPTLAKILKDKYRILAEPIGSLSHLSQQKQIKGPPFQLDPISLAFLVKNHKESLQFEGLENFSLSDTIEQDTYIIFETLLNKGYYLISAQKFGAKFLVYDSDPASNHAKYLVFLSDDEITGIPEVSSTISDNLIFINRLTTIAKKEAILAKVNRMVSHTQNEDDKNNHSNSTLSYEILFSKMQRLQHY